MKPEMKKLIIANLPYLLFEMCIRDRLYCCRKNELYQTD